MLFLVYVCSTCTGRDQFFAELATFDQQTPQHSYSDGSRNRRTLMIICFAHWLLVGFSLPFLATPSDFFCLVLIYLG